jgi:CTP synthase
VTLVPYLKASGEHKSKPTQHSVKELQGFGISPDIIVLRSDEPITDQSIFTKIAHFCNVKPDCVIENLTLDSLYEAPLMLEQAHLSEIVCRELNLQTPPPDLSEWQALCQRIRAPRRRVTIALAGKYVQLHDAYLSVAEALHHAGYQLGADVQIDWIDSEQITRENAAEMLDSADGILIPGGFGERGIEGMIAAAEFARTAKKPFLGICLGMQIAVIEYARHMAGMPDAHSGEFAPHCTHKVIDFMPGQSDSIDKGGTLRLGAYPCIIQAGTLMERCYNTLEIQERHRHRYEYNNDYRDILTDRGLTISGLSPDGKLVETVEIGDHPFYIGVQFHPEFKSRPKKPHPIFKGFVEAALGQ